MANSIVKNAKGRLLKWSLLLQGYNFEVSYKSAKLNAVADWLSRVDHDKIEQQTPIFQSAIENSDLVMRLNDQNEHTEINQNGKPTSWETHIEYYSSIEVY